MTAKAFSSPLSLGIPALLAGIAIVAAGASAALAQPPSPAEIESPVGRRAAAQYKVSATPLSLTEVATPIRRHEAERFRQTQRAYIKSPWILNAALAQPGVAALSVFGNSTDKTGWLKEHLLVTFPGDGEIMEITVADAKAPKEDLVALANAVSKAYYDEVVFREQGERTLPLQILKASLQRLSSQIRDKMETLHQLETDHGVNADGTAKRQWLMDEARLLRQRIEELQTQRFDEKLSRLQTDEARTESSSAKDTDEKRAAIDDLFAAEEKRLKARLDETLGSAAAYVPAPNTDLELRRQEIEWLKETEKWLTRRIQLLQIETQGPNRINAIGQKGDEVAAVEFYEK
jgi:hypothetical protein